MIVDVFLFGVVLIENRNLKEMEYVFNKVFSVCFFCLWYDGHAFFRRYIRGRVRMGIGDRPGCGRRHWRSGRLVLL